VDYSIEHFSATLPALAANILPLRKGIVNFAESHGAKGAALGDIGLAVGEALNNVVLHAYREEPAPGRMTIDAHVEMASLAVAVIDEGLGFAPRCESPGLGLGMPIIAQLASTLSVVANGDRAQPGTTVLMGFRLA
jgi:anti-sigma regulatory factor (Ser/Thr protein kinase)